MAAVLSRARAACVPVFLEYGPVSHDIGATRRRIRRERREFEMANGFDPRATAAPHTAAKAGRESVAFDAGLRSHMLSVYNYMASAVLLTGLVAYGAAAAGIAQQIFFEGGILKYVVLFAPLIMVFVLAARLNRMSTGGLQVFYWSFAAVMGLSMSLIPLIYSGTSIAATFFATSAAFV